MPPKTRGAVRKPRRKDKKNIALGQAHIKSTFNNTIVSITAQEHGMRKVDVFVKGPGSGRETAIRSLQAAGLEVGSISDVSPSAHNGCRPSKRRRV